LKNALFNDADSHSHHTVWRRGEIEKLTVPNLINKLSLFYGSLEVYSFIQHWNLLSTSCSELYWYHERIYSYCGVCSWPWQWFALRKAYRHVFVTTYRCML